MSGVVDEIRGQAWFCTTGLPSDVVVDVDDMTFHLHKFPLMSKSRKLHQMIEHNTKPRDDDGDAVGDEVHRISLPCFPGGAATFEAAAKFCYAGKLDITPWTAASLRCAAEYLDMSDDFSQDNLISRTDHFLAHSVFPGLRESLQVLNSCHRLLPMADDLGIVQRCVDSIAAYACSADPVNAWPVNDSVLWNGIDTGARRHARSTSSASTTAGSWVEDLAMLSLPFYKRVIAAIRAADPASEALEGSLLSYARISIPGLSRSERKQASASAPVASETEQRELLDTVIANLPAENKSAAGATTTRFLFRLLRTVNILQASEASRAALERRIASQLEQATVDDLLIPSYSYQVETLYDVGCLDRILAYFLNTTPTTEERMERVGRLVDGYLAEIASDTNLKPHMFCDLALALPDHARIYDDGLYRAVDVYLKAHAGITEEERERVSGVMDCHKLTLEACTHAAQNERLPLRAVIQVLFFEQLQLRHAIAGTQPPPDTHAAGRRGAGWRSSAAAAAAAAARENQVLRLDMDSMSSRVRELEKECSTMRNKIERMDGQAPAPAPPPPPRWSSFAKRFGCRFKTQVCDSHERTVVESTKR